MTGVIFNWIGGSGNWNDPANWSHNPPPPDETDRSLPNAEDTVNIPPSAGTVSTINIPAACGTLNLAANLIVGSTLGIYSENGGTLNLSNDATVSFSGTPSALGFVNNNNPPGFASFVITGQGTIKIEAGKTGIISAGNNSSLEVGAGITIRATGSGANGHISAPKLINRGTIVSDAPTIGFGMEILQAGPHDNSFFTNYGTIRSSNGGILRIGSSSETSKLVWHNAGEIEINGGTLHVGGIWKQSNLGDYTRVGGSVFIGGKFTGGLHLDDHSGSWTQSGGVIEASRITTEGNNTFSVTQGTLDRCTIANTAATVVAFGSAGIRNGLTLENATLHLNDDLIVNGTQTIGGSGQMLFNGVGGGSIALQGASQTLTIDNNIVLRTDAHGGTVSGPTNSRLIIKGQVAATTSGRTINISTPFCDVFGQLAVGSGATLNLSGVLDIKSSGALMVSPTGTLQSNKDITGNTSNAARVRPGGKYSLTGGTGASPPQLLEVMSQDRGADTEGYRNNFALGRLTINNTTTKLTLQDASDNAQGGSAEALYVDSLEVPSGAILDLNGLNLYVRATSIAGTITGGTITMLSDSGPILLGTPTSGRILVGGEQDDWTFFGRAGQTISTILVAGGAGTAGSLPPLSPAMGSGKITILRPDGTVLSTANTASSVATLADQVLPVDGTYKLRVEGQLPSTTGIYVLSAYDVTTTTRPYLLNTTASGEIATPFAKDKWKFSLAAGQEIQFDFIAATTSGLQFTLEGPGGYFAFNNITDDSAVITVPGGTGGQFALTVKGSSDQTGAYSFVVRDSSVTPLALGTPFAGVLSGSGAARWFSMSLPDPGQLLITLDDSTNSNRNEVYLRRGALPTRAEYDYRLPSLSADGEIYVPDAAEGDWFILVYANLVPAASNYTLTADYSELRITSITPDRYGVGNMMTMTLFGGGYEPGTTLKLVSGATTINASTVEIDSFTQITATFNLTGAPQTTFDVVVENGAMDFTLPDGFQTLPNVPAELEMKLNMPGNATRNSTTTFSVEYANTGNVAMPAPLIIVQSADPEGDQHPILSLDLSRILETFWSTTIPHGTSERVMILGSGNVPGVLNPGERIRVPIQYLGEKAPIVDNDILLQLEARCVESGSPEGDEEIDWDDLKNDLKPPSLPSPIWDQIYSNITGSLESVDDYVALLRANAEYLGRLGLKVVDIDELWNFEVIKALGAISAFSTLSAAVDAALPAPGVSLSLTRRFAGDLISRNYDGPFGYGWSVPWFATLSRDANDDVLTIISSGGSQRSFLRDARANTPLTPSGKYFSGAGDSSSIARVTTDIYELTDSGGTVTRFRADGKIDYVEDANGNRVTASYNGSGRLVTLTHTSGESISIGYNGSGRISLVSDSMGHSSTYGYDGSGDHLLSVTADDGTASTYSYDTTSDVLRAHTLLSESSAGATRIFTYDSNGRISSTSLAGGAQLLNLSYDSGKITLSDAAGTAQLYFDHKARLARQTNPLGFSTNTQYDENNNPAKITLPDGSSQRYEWCDCGSLMSLTDELGQTIKFAYNDLDKLTSITDAKGNVSRFTYDAAGNRLQHIRADGTVEGASNLNASGLAQTFTNARGQVVTYGYNADGQITSDSVNGSTYSYDARGRLYHIDAGNETVLDYDTAVDGDRLKRITYPGGRYIEHDYDADGRLTATRDHSGFTTRYDYDAAGRLFRLRDTAGSTLTTYTYDAAGRITRTDNANGTFTTFGHDSAGNLLSIQNFRSVGVLNSSFVYTYDSRNRRITAATSDGTWSYGYDRASQLTSATFVSTNPSIDNQNIQVIYDDAGNREFMTFNGDLIDYGTNAMNQYISVDGVAFDYDLDGNLIFDGNREYTYDQFNRLTQVDDGVNTETYGYSVLGQLVSKIVNGVRTDYLASPAITGVTLAEYDAGGTLLARNIFGAGLIGRTDGGGNIDYFDFDAVGSTAGISDATGAYINEYAYNPFGQSLLSSETLSNPYQFIGEFGARAGTAGLTHMGMREYSSDLGRFTSVDPLRMQADVNTYRYAANSPVMNIDPSGLYVQVAEEFVLGHVFGSAVDNWSTVAQGGSPTFGDASVSFALNAGFGFPGAAGFANAVGVSMNPEIFGNIIQGVCGLKRQRDFGTINIGAAKQLAALEGGKGAGGASVDEGCNIDSGSGDASMNLGDRCAYGEVPLVFSVDPNDKTAPVGFGPDNHVPIGNAIDYVIDFENIGPGSVDENEDPFPRFATAPAQRVIIADQLSADLDWSSVQFTEFSFGETIIPVSDGLGSFHTSVNAELDGVTFTVEIDAQIDLSTGILTVIFQSIDEVTGLPPAPFVGLLPPEDGTGNGMGYFRFSVNPVSSLTDGTQIRNIALIQFDANEVIATNQINPLDASEGTDPGREALVTIDANAPSVVAGPTFLHDADSPRVTIQFSEDVQASLIPEKVQAQNLTTSTFIVPAGIDYEAATQTATIDLGAALPDGNYHLTIHGLMDGVGHPLPDDIELDFFFLAADANRDRFVDTLDFNILAGNFSASGVNFSQGDFNYDDTTDSLDFNTLVAKFGTRLALPAAPLGTPNAPLSSAPSPFGDGPLTVESREIRPPSLE